LGCQKGRSLPVGQDLCFDSATLLLQDAVKRTRIRIPLPAMTENAALEAVKTGKAVNL
jgi:ribosome recycling factor